MHVQNKPRFRPTARRPGTALHLQTADYCWLARGGQVLLLGRRGSGFCVGFLAIGDMATVNNKPEKQLVRASVS